MGPDVPGARASGLCGGGGRGVVHGLVGEKEGKEMGGDGSQFGTREGVPFQLQRALE